MSKVISILLIIVLTLFLLPSLNASIAQSTPSCNSKGITYSPTVFPPNPAEIRLNFKINNENALNRLKGKQVRLHFKTSFISGITFGTFWSDYNTNPVTVTNDSFSITANGNFVYHTKSPGTHIAVLDWQPGSDKFIVSDFEELCSGIVYTTGDPYTCVIGWPQQSTIPPSSNLTIKFSGAPKTNYGLQANRTRVLAKINTDDQGQGEFKNVDIPGKNGDTTNLEIFYNNLHLKCSKQIKIDLNAPQPGPPGTEPVPIAKPGTIPGPGGQPAKPAGPPTVAGGELKSGCTDKGGVSTAIGCIHTNPAEFAKDFMTFAIGISGGLAFLMMLLGAFQILTSSGNPDTLKAGQDRLTSAVIGLLFVIFAVLLLQIIGADILKIPDFKP